MSATATRKPKLDNWFRELRNDRLEICLIGKTADGVDIKMRCSGPRAQVWRMIEMFEEMTGKEVVGDWKRPPRSGPRPLAGQLSMIIEQGGVDVEE